LLFILSAELIPSFSETKNIKTILITFIIKVIGSLAPISLITLFPLENETPKSKDKIELNHDINLSNNGLSNPYTLFKCSMDSGVIFGFSVPLAKKLFGANEIAPNEMIEITKIIKATYKNL
jgi:hypothetical protein